VSAPPDNPLAAHARECDDCGAAAPPLAELAARLDADALEIDAARLSAAALALVLPELQAYAQAAFWRRLVRALAVALLPLPLVLAADLWLLGWLYDLAAAWLPSGIALYLVASYAVSALVVIGAAYAAIPLLIARPLRAPEAALA
jgi:hypothetical protein